jgi:hypothetical protein
MTVQRHRGLTEQAAQAAVDQACRMLRLPTIRGQFPELAEAATREQMSYLGFLAELLMAECDDRARRRSERRIKAAAFPRTKSLRAFSGILIGDAGVHGRPGGKPTWGPPAHAPHRDPLLINRLPHAPEDRRAGPGHAGVYPPDMP